MRKNVFNMVASGSEFITGLNYFYFIELGKGKILWIRKESAKCKNVIHINRLTIILWIEPTLNSNVYTKNSIKLKFRFDPNFKIKLAKRPDERTKNRIFSKWIINESHEYRFGR